MKKLLFIFGTVAILGTTACSHGSAAGKEEKILGDSISLAFGQVSGKNIQEMVERQKARPGAQNQPELNIDKFVKGMEAVLNADTTSNFSYISGMSFALQRLLQAKFEMAVDTVPFDTRLFIQGFMKAYNDTALANNYQTTYSDLQGRLSIMHRQKEEVRMAIEREKNEAAGTAYVDSVKNADPEVMTSETGLVYKIIEPGSEPKVTKEDRIKLNYKGYTVDGTVFDETNGSPRTLGAGGFIPGFNEGLTLIGEGGKAILYIPGNLAYGDHGVPQKGIGPNTTLVFEIEVTEILPKEDVKK